MVRLLVVQNLPLEEVLGNLYCIITGFKDNIEALQAEWRIKRVEGERDRQDSPDPKVGLKD